MKAYGKHVRIRFGKWHTRLHAPTKTRLVSPAIQTKEIRIDERRVVHIGEGICSSPKADGIGLHVSAYRGIEVPEVVVVLLRQRNSQVLVP